VEPIRLLSNFVTTTSTTLAWFNDTRWTWEIEVPQHAENNPFLRHALLATSALHICFLQPPNRNDYHIAAYQNYREATLLFRSSVTEITRENCIAVLAFSLLISVFQLGIVSAPADRAPEEAFVQLIQALSALRSAYSLIPQLHPHLGQSRVSSIFLRRRRFEFKPLDNNRRQALERLDSLNSRSNAPLDVRTTRTEAICLLRKWFSLTSGSPSTWLHFVYWPSSLSEGYISLFKQNDPISLAIFCHWSESIGRGSQKWFLAGWAEQTRNVAVRLLGPEWQPVLE
jgi:Fungal specific transcription factor domain